MALGAGDRPQSVHLLVRRPGGAVDETFDAQFTDDTVFIAVLPDSVRRSIAAQRAYPMLGGSIAMFEALIAAARSGRHAPDSTAVVAVPITGPFIAEQMPVALLAANAARVGPPGGPTRTPTLAVLSTRSLRRMDEYRCGAWTSSISTPSRLPHTNPRRVRSQCRHSNRRCRDRCRA